MGQVAERHRCGISGVGRPRRRFETQQRLHHALYLVLVGCAPSTDGLFDLVRRVLHDLGAGRRAFGHGDATRLGHPHRGANVHLEEDPLDGDHLGAEFLDEAAQLGCVISALIRNDLPLAWLSDGQRIPDDLHGAARKKLWLVNQAVECMEASNPTIDEQLLADHYSSTDFANAG